MAVANGSLEICENFYQSSGAFSIAMLQVEEAVQILRGNKNNDNSLSERLIEFSCGGIKVTGET